MHSRRTILYQFNGRLFGLSIGIAAAIGIGAYFLHARQVRAMAESFLARADQLEQRNEFDEASRNIGNYIALRPDDREARARYAMAVDRAARDFEQIIRATQLYYQALGGLPERADLRARLAELLFEELRFSEARDEARTILTSEPDNAHIRRMLALSEFYLRRGDQHSDWAHVGELLTDAIEANSTDIELAECMAELQRKYLEPAQGDDADRTMDQLVEAADHSPPSLLARAMYRQKYNLPGADSDLDTALASAPDDVNVLLAVADRARTRLQLDEAITRYTSLIERAPLDRRGYLGLGEAYVQRGDFEQATATWRTGLQKIGRGDLILGWKLADTLIEQNQPDAADEQLSTFLRAIRKLQTQSTTRQYESIYNAYDYLRAKYWILKSKPLRAIQILSRLAAVSDSYSEDSPLRVSQLEVQWRLAGAWGLVGRWEQSATAYEAAAQKRPLEPTLRLAAAKAWMMASQPENGIRHLEVLASRPPVAAEAALLYAQALYVVQMRVPRSQRDWSAFDRAVAQVTDLGSNGWHLLLLQSDAAVANGHPEDAVKRLDQAASNYNSQAQCLAAVALGYEKLGISDKADETLERLAQIATVPTTAILARVEVLCRRKKLASATELLQSEIAKSSPSDRAVLSNRLAQLFIQRGMLAEGRQAFAELVQLDPGNLQLAQQQAELAIESHDRELASRCESQLRELEGEDGTWWRLVRARRLLEVKEQSNLTEIERLTTELESTRPSWSEVHCLRGLLAERQGNSNEAAEAFRRALASGNRRISDYERLISILFRTQQFDAAGKVLAEIQQQTSDSDLLSSLAVAVSLKQSDADRALGLAKDWARRSPKDPLPQIWLGQAELLANHQADAAKAFQRATELAPGDSRAWQALFQYYLQTKQLNSARETLEHMARDVPLSEVKREELLGEGNELLGDLPTAVAHLQKALLLSPSDAILQRLAAILVRTNDPAVEQILDRLEDNAKNGKARRDLVLLLLARGDSASWEKAWKLLSTTDERDIGETSANNRLRALLLIRRGRPDDRPEAIRMLSGLVGIPEQAQPADRMLLVQLYQAEGLTDLAGDQLRVLADQAKAPPAQIAMYAEFLLKNGKADDAKVWIDKLQQAWPGNWIGISLEAQWLHAQKRDAEVKPLIEESAKRRLAASKDDHEKAQVAASVGQLYNNLGQSKPAIDYNRMAYDLTPELYAPLVVSLCTDRQVSVALEICRTAGKSDSGSQPARTLASALVSSGCPAEKFGPNVDEYLAQALQQFADDTQLLLIVSGVRYAQGNMQAVMDLSRQVLAREPKNLLAMNNLSSLLAESPEHQAEALELVNRALDGQSQNSILLDTKAMILFYQDQLDAAKQLLEQIIAKPITDPRIRFHCALVYQRLNDIDRARDFLAKARTAGLAIATLSPTEQKLLSKLEQALEAPAGATNARLPSSDIR
jgi:cellulose synthase operon protein C